MTKRIFPLLLIFSIIGSSPSFGYHPPKSIDEAQDQANSSTLFALIYSVDLLKSALDNPESELEEALEEVPIFDRNWEAFAVASNATDLSDTYTAAKDLIQAGQIDQAREILDLVEVKLDQYRKPFKKAKVRNSESDSISKSLVGYNDFETNPYFSQPYNFRSGGTMRDNLRPLLLPVDHFLKPALDALFLAKRVTADPESALAAGFYNTQPQYHSATIVTGHPSLSGYLFKFFFDKEIKKGRGIKPYWYWLYRRVLGARTVQQIIKEKGITRFTVPNKWLYPLPMNPPPPNAPNYKRKDLVIVEDAFDLAHPDLSEKAWRENITREHLLELYWIVFETSFFGTQIKNIPLLKDGRFGFVDMEYCFSKRPDFDHIRKALSKKSRRILNEIIRNGGKYW